MLTLSDARCSFFAATQGRGGHRGGGGGGARGGPGSGGRGGSNHRGGGRGGGPSGGAGERPKKEAILDLTKYKDQKIRVKFTGGREVIGVLKGHDQLMNMVLDDVEEAIRSECMLGPRLEAWHLTYRSGRPSDPETGDLTGETRSLGLAVLRGTALTVINPADGYEEIQK